MKTRAFKQWLAGQGVTFKEGTRHTKAYNGSKQATIPRHQEIPDLLVRKIKQQLGLM